MKPSRSGRLALAFAVGASAAAHAEPPKPAARACSSARHNACRKSCRRRAKPAPPVAPKPAAATGASAIAPAAIAPTAMSESKYLSLLYSEISRRTPEENAAGPGEVTASFIVGASGKVEKVTIDKTTSPAHAEIVKKILASVAAPPPPGGKMDVGQTFRFR